MSDPFRLLFVCTANICRSAYADVLSRHLLAGDPSVEVSSAGTHGFVDQPVDPPMAEELRTRQVDPDGFSSRLLTMAMIERADLVLTAEVVHRQFILDERPELFRRVFTLGQMARTLDAAGPLDAHGRALVRGLRSSFQAALPDDDVADPYGRGPEAASRTAAQLELLVRRVVPALAERSSGWVRLR